MVSDLIQELDGFWRWLNVQFILQTFAQLVKLAQGQVWQGEICNKRKDGGLYWEFATISPVKDQHGNTTHYVAIKEDKPIFIDFYATWCRPCKMLKSVTFPRESVGELFNE